MTEDERARGEGFFEIIVGNGNVNAGIGRLLLLVIAFIVIFGTGFWYVWPK
jgi:hypothetical protein